MAGERPIPPREEREIVERGPSLHLDVLEDLFGKLWKRWQHRGGKDAMERTLAPHAARLEELEVAVGAVVGAFAGHRVRVRPAEAAGGVLGGVVLLPARVVLGADPRANRDHLFVRAAIAGAVVAARERLEAASPGPDEGDEPDVLREAVDVALGLAARHPGFRARVVAAARLEMASRPDLVSLPAHERPLESLRQAALRDLAALGDDSPPSSRDSRFPAALIEFRNLDPAVTRPPPRSFFHRLMRSRPPAPKGPGPLLLLGGELSPSDRDSVALALAEAEQGSGAAEQEREAPVRDHVRTTTVEEDPYKENMPSHSFEKIDFADKYEGGFRRLDGADDMDEQGESLDGVDLREMIRGGPEVQSVYRAEIGDVGEIPDVMGAAPGEHGITYDEWDQARKCYRRDWVTLYPTSIEVQKPSFGRDLERELSGTRRRSIRALEAYRTERIIRRRQLDGDEIDLEAVIDEYADRRRGQTPAGRLYIHSPVLERDVATCVLLDVSLSSDSWVENRRVLDVELAAACVLGGVADAFDDQLSILAFASNTRNLCRVWTVKGWDEPWKTGRARLGALTPQGYTRIGPAIRHGTALLLEHPARKKHLILVTDGKPTDFDRYEGSHGIHDVAWAVREARRGGVRVLALGIDPRAATILPSMFGPGGWRVLRHIADLPEALVRAYG